MFLFRNLLKGTPLAPVKSILLESSGFGRINPLEKSFEKNITSLLLILSDEESFSRTLICPCLSINFSFAIEAPLFYLCISCRSGEGHLRFHIFIQFYYTLLICQSQDIMRYYLPFIADFSTKINGTPKRPEK